MRRCARQRAEYTLLSGRANPKESFGTASRRSRRAHESATALTPRFPPRSSINLGEIINGSTNLYSRIGAPQKGWTSSRQQMRRTHPRAQSHHPPQAIATRARPSRDALIRARKRSGSARASDRAEPCEARRLATRHDGFERGAGRIIFAATAAHAPLYFHRRRGAQRYLSIISRQRNAHDGDSACVRARIIRAIRSTSLAPTPSMAATQMRSERSMISCSNADACFERCAPARSATTEESLHLELPKACCARSPSGDPKSGSKREIQAFYLHGSPFPVSTCTTWELLHKDIRSALTR